MLYLAEAHSEQWPLSLNAPASHGDVTQRLAAAQALLHDFPALLEALEGHIYTDTFSNDMTLAYGLWPERYLLLEAGVVQWASALSFEERSTKIPEQLRAAASAYWAPHRN